MFRQTTEHNLADVMTQLETDAKDKEMSCFEESYVSVSTAPDVKFRQVMGYYALDVSRPSHRKFGAFHGF